MFKLGRKSKLSISFALVIAFKFDCSLDRFSRPKPIFPTKFNDSLSRAG
jgi:hypothetical protein